MKEPIKLKFSEKYDAEHSRQYYLKHQDGFSRRMSHLREEQLARKALKLAGEPLRVLDLPCGAGRFWPLLSENPTRSIIAADNSPHMLDVARSVQDRDIVERVETLHTSAFDIALPDNAVDTVFSIRLLHHIGQSAHRLAILREFHRVAKESVIVSLWVGGNFKALRRERSERQRKLRRGGVGDEYQNRFVLPSAIVEQEFFQAGFKRYTKLDFIPYYSMWRVYVLHKS
ncbi:MULTISPECIES: class I SAM-dependent methyltransferase [Pseudomonas]|uniref:Class I SAM-dependent methyltransferase n=1 Tax=Pseudomonas aphyarum TaxID=2942629 RepID=A0ABT5PPV9_9PSED|nr:class I SAM-dependent methyltransferase [Pseudomonas aphyarum]MDD0971117.1 class I SAM-dependent methyltransferase [Pseudomonas aphyarum]MDD1125917.1 class I SAM-dependent methyltransferase [Pseudomonas aphyarum]